MNEEIADDTHHIEILNERRRPASYPQLAPTRIELSIGASGRFVRVSLDGTDYLSLAEVQVFAACVPAKETPHNDQALALGGNLFGFSVNMIRGPRDCGGQRVSRSVIKLDGTGSCSVVDDGDIFWANELCARNPHMVVGNSEIGAACQELYAGGSDLGDHDCRYIVHAGAGPAFEGLGCQPSHVTRVAAYCLPPPTGHPSISCPAGFKCCDYSEEHHACEECVPQKLSCP